MSPGHTIVLFRRYVGPMLRSLSAALAMLVATVVLVAGCSNGGDQASPTTGAPSGDGDERSFCASARSMSGAGGIDLAEGADESVEAVRTMSEQAPPELAGDFEVFLAGLERVSQLEEDDPAALQAIVELVGDGKFASAVDRIRDAVQEDCGVDINVSTGPLQE